MTDPISSGIRISPINPNNATVGNKFGAIAIIPPMTLRSIRIITIAITPNAVMKLRNKSRSRINGQSSTLGNREQSISKMNINIR